MSRRVAILATCNLNQWAMDFQGNLQRVKASIEEARAQGARYRVGPELELSGYGCEDHFYEVDTVSHAWEALAALLQGELTCDMLCDVGMPVIHRGVLYNCRVFLLNRRVLLIRPKLAMANDGNYRETRYFSAWKHRVVVEQMPLPACVVEATDGKQEHAAFGDGVLRLADTTLAAETCEELFTPRAPHIDLALAGVEVVSNGSGSHHQLRKLDTRLDLIRSATAKAGGVYLYANQRGCDGGRLYYDGCASVVVNGQLVAQGAQFGLQEVQVVTATVDLDEVVSYRGSIASLREQASLTTAPAYVEVPGWSLCHTAHTASPGKAAPHGQTTARPLPPSQATGTTGPPAAAELTAAAGSPAEGNPAAMSCAAVKPLATADGLEGGSKASDEAAVASCLQPSQGDGAANGCMHSLTAVAAALRLFPSPPIPPRLHVPEEEIAYGPACWLWDYLRRAGASGFLLPLSGGADSSSTAAIVGAMCQMVAKAVAAGDAQVTADAARIGQYKPEEPVAPTAQEFANRIFCTTYMGTVNSSKETRDRARQLAQEVGCHHLDVGIDSVVSAMVELFVVVTGKRPAFKADGGTAAENLALQNIQARLRMVVAFLLAQLVPWARGRAGWLLVLGSANVDEALRGYLTKYDCSSADINPIGGVSKQDLRRFLRWAATNLGYPSLAHVEAAPPTAELEPLREGIKPQNDEDDMGMTYEELSVYGRLRKVARCGPVSMFMRCMDAWHTRFSPAQIAAKVKHFFTYYAINRHKTTVLTPSYHAESYSPDDNRFDHRQFLYNIRWPWQFQRIDRLAAQYEAAPTK